MSDKHSRAAATIIDGREKERERGRERRERMQNHDHGIARYTWIIDFIHERTTSSASKIPVALLIVVNCLLYIRPVFK